MQDLMKIETTPAAITANFDEVEGQLREYLQQYDVVVTPDRVGDAKKLRTELRKQISELDTRIKDALKDASEPIREADERRKQLVKLGRDVDTKIKEQVERCEAETKKRVEQLLSELRDELWIKYGVDDEFKSAEFDGLIKLGSITKKGKLAKSATDTLDARVREDKLLQARTERRIADLAGASYEAGLASPLTREYVESFLFAADDTYQARLQRLLDTEVERQQKAEPRMRENAEREARQRAEEEQKQAERQKRLGVPARAEHATPQEAAAEPETPEADVPPWEPEPAPVPARAKAEPAQGDGKVTWFVAATFEIRTPPSVTTDDIRAECRRVLEAAGITTLKNVTAQRKQGRAA